MIFGHQKNLKIFSKMIAENRFPHAVLFAGPEKIGKRKIALEIAKYLETDHSSSFDNFFEFSQGNCSCDICKQIEEKNFYDLMTIDKEKKEKKSSVKDNNFVKDRQIHIKKIRDIKQQISLSSPYPFKIVIIDHSESLTEEATGSLLKILEEPRGNTIFFLLTSSPNYLPTTILSRVEMFKFYPLSRIEMEAFLKSQPDQKEKEEIIGLVLGRPGLAKEFLIDKNKIIYYNLLLGEIKKIRNLSILQRLKLAEDLEKTERTQDFLFLTEFWFRDLLLRKQGLSSFYPSFFSKEKELEEEKENFSEIKLKEIIFKIKETKNYLYFSNTNPLLAMENLLLGI